MPFLFEAPDLMDEDADEVDEEERISMGTAWCNETMLGLALPWTLLPIIDWVDIWSLNSWWWNTSLSGVKKQSNTGKQQVNLDKLV